MVSGGYGGGDIPVPIPNTAVKPTSADGTWGSPPGRVGRRRDFLNGPHHMVGAIRIGRRPRAAEVSSVVNDQKKRSRWVLCGFLAPLTRGRRAWGGAHAYAQQRGNEERRDREHF